MSVSINWAGLVTIVAVFAAYMMFRLDMKKNGYSSIICEELFLGFVIFGVIGARIGYFLIGGFKGFAGFLYIWDGKWEVLGGLATASLFALVYCRKNYMSTLRMLDCALPHVLLALGLARIPNCFGNPRMILVMGVDLLGYILLVFVYRKYFKDRHRGDDASLALLWIGFSRFFINVAIYHRRNLTAGMKYPGLLIAGVAFALYVYNRLRKHDAKPLVLFDFDGTLMDTQEMVNESYRYLFDKYKTVDDFDDRTQIEVFGANDKAAIKKLFKGEDPNELTQEFRTFQSNLPALGLVNTMPHALEVLMWLKKNGYTVGVVTSRPTDNCRYWIEEFDLEDYVDMVMGAETYKKAKPAPDGIRRICHEMKLGHDNCVYIGDHARDVRSAARACVYAIGYITSEQNRKRIRKAKPNRMITDLLELEDILQETDHDWTYNKL